MRRSHKLGIVFKELHETGIWLKLTVKTVTMKKTQLNPLIDERSELMNIVGVSIVTTKANAPAKSNAR